MLRTLRVVYSDGEHPIEATVTAKAGHLYELQYEFTPSWTSPGKVFGVMANRGRVSAAVDVRQVSKVGPRPVSSLV